MVHPFGEDLILTAPFCFVFLVYFVVPTALYSASPLVRLAGLDPLLRFGIGGAPGISFAVASVGGLSNARNANRSAKSFFSSNVSMSSGIIVSLLTRVYLTLWRGTMSFPSLGISFFANFAERFFDRPKRVAIVAF